MKAHVMLQILALVATAVAALYWTAQDEWHEQALALPLIGVAAPPFALIAVGCWLLFQVRWCVAARLVFVLGTLASVGLIAVALHRERHGREGDEPQAPDMAMALFMMGASALAASVTLTMASFVAEKIVSNDAKEKRD